MRLEVTNFETGEKTIVESQDVIVANFISKEDVGKDIVDKTNAVIEALAAAANLLDEISYSNIPCKSRIAGIYAAQAIQLKQQIETLESLIQ